MSKTEKLKCVIAALRARPYELTISLTEIETLETGARLDILLKFLEQVNAEIPREVTETSELLKLVSEMIIFLGFPVTKHGNSVDVSIIVSDTDEFVNALHWCFSNEKYVTERVYLSKFLHQNYPDSVLGDPGFLELYNRLQIAQETFKDIHKRYSNLTKGIEGRNGKDKKKTLLSLIEQKEFLEGEMKHRRQETMQLQRKRGVKYEKPVRDLFYARKRKSNILKKYGDSIF